MPYLADDLVAAVRRRGRLPDEVLTSADIMELADEEIGSTILPMVRDLLEEYYVHEADQSVTADQAEYRIPPRAQGASLRDVTLEDTSNNEFPVPQIALEHRGLYREGASYWWPRGVGYTMQGDKIVLLPTPKQTGFTLRVRFYRRPGLLVEATDAAQITSITGVDSIAATVPASWSTSNTFDLIQAKPNFDSLADDLSAVTVTATDIKFTVPVPSDLVVGDWVSLATESPVVQVPAEVQPVLFHATLVAALEAIGDRQGATWAQAKLTQKLSDIQAMLEPRVDGASQRVVNWDGPLRYGRRRWK